MTTTEQTLLEAIRGAMHDALAWDARVVVLGEDVAVKGGVFLATDGLLERFGALRVIDMPIAEAGIVGVAIGMALHGLRPVAEIQFADYLYPAIDQILNEAARMRYRSNGDWNCPLVIRAPFGGGIHGALYHSQSVEALFTSTPGLKVVVPATPHDARGLLLAAIADPDPVLFLEHKRLYRTLRGPVATGQGATVPLGVAACRRPGRDVSIITYGAMVHESLRAADALAHEGVDLEVIDLRTLVPLDRDAVLATVRRTGRALIVSEDNLTGGFAGEIAAVIAEHGFADLDAPVRRLAAPDVPAVPFSETLEDAFMVSAAKIMTAARELARY
ncbi:MAG: alpha-ketoacid dehydrogenase subunit beta [Chloroflexi bacterium]|nr:alpha-ketoacid dehydrogenase subunit beta [Chloroflexota bacterium]